MTPNKEKKLATPNQMPKKPSLVRQQIVAALIETKKSGWNRKVFTQGEDGKQVETTVKVEHDALRYPLAQNVSDVNVERLSRRWL